MNMQNRGRMGTKLKSTSGFLILVLLALFAMTLYTVVQSNTLSNGVLENAIVESTDRTDVMHEGFNKLIETEDFTEINTIDDKESERYQNIQAHMNEIRSMNSTRYFYTAKRNSSGRLVYLVDGLDKDAEDFRNPGDLIEDEMIPYIERALSGECVYSQDIVDTTWGHIFTSCYPVYDDASGQIIGAVCIETDMEPTYAFISDHQIALRNSAIVAAIIMIALMICVFLFVRHYQRRDEEDQRKLLNSYSQLEDALARETKHSEIISALANIYTTIFVVDLETRTYEIIESVDLMHGVTARSGSVDGAVEGILGTFMAPEMRASMREFLDVGTLPERMGPANTIMTEYRNPDGRWFQARFIAKKRNEQGAVTEVLYAARDFTDEKKRELDLQEQLIESATEAKKANLSKTSFLRRMSHDIRTPLNGIIGMLHIQERYADDPVKSAECKQKILHSADYLLDLVNNVLDISKLESGALELENKPFDLAELLLKSLSVVETTATENGVKMTGGVESSSFTHRSLIGSAVHLNRILMNLASNAIKYNRVGGEVFVSATEIACDDDTATFRFVCKDNGLGMSEEFQKHAFEPFSQEGKETTTSFTGSGLGLSIVKDIVEMMGGTIALQSKENVGTAIEVVLTFEIDHDAQGATARPKAAKPIDLRGRRVLVVEDNELNMEIAHLMLEEAGLAVTEASNGAEAVCAFEASEEGFFDYVLMDVMMPVMDGITATRAIRALDRPDAKTVPIVAMTANAFAEDRRDCLDAGMNDHISKPIDVEAIRETLSRISVATGQGDR